jgi:AcrR family transcriptional regulator
MRSELLEAVARTRRDRAAAEAAYRAAIVAARRAHSVAEIAEAAGITPAGVWYLLSPNQYGRKKEET